MGRRKKKNPLDALALCAIAAWDEGLSYGKYMAKYGYRPPCLEGLEEPKQKKKQPEVRKCAKCGAEFSPCQAKQRFCGYTCNVLYYEGRRRHERQLARQKPCVICGELLPLGSASTRVCCSNPACKRERNHQMEHLRRKKNKDER